MSASSDPVSAALEAVLDRFADRVRSIGRRHGLEGDDVSDLVQEVRVRLWHALETGEKILAVPPSYVHRTAVTAALDVLRRRRARRETPVRMSRPSGEGILGEAPSVDDRLGSSELEDQIARSLEGIPESRRPVVRMYLAGYGREEIAGLLGWTEAKTRNLLYRGLADLRERLTEIGIGPEATL
jgi:RNA polymerase sigma-70 factor (ECF subfamily)